MIKVVNKKEKEQLRTAYVGKRVRLLKMKDKQAPPPGTLGTVTGVDDFGDLLMRWDTGSSLKLILEVDSFVVLENNSAV